MTLTFAGLLLAVLGAGKWSLDQAIGWRDDLVGTPGLLIAIVAGGGGAALLLATAWRPTPKPAEA
jgi:putative oxidoreductase